MVFLIRLRKVNRQCSLAEIIIDEHDQLTEMDKRMIQLLLEGKTDKSVLLLLDGYDEYTTGVNTAIDKAIESRIGNCFLILTSRPGTDSGDKTYVSKEIRDKMDGEVRIDGFNDESIKRFCTEYFGSGEEADNLLDQAYEKLGRNPDNTQYWSDDADSNTDSDTDSNTYSYNELLSTPIVLLMICALYEENRSLPDTRTRVYETVRELAMDRTTWKTFGCRSSQVKDIQKMTYILGKFAWEALKKDIQQLLLNKVDISILFFNDLSRCTTLY